MNVIRCFTQRNALLIKMKVSNRRKRYDVLRNTASAEMGGIMDQTTRLILAAVVGMILLLVLIIKFKIHAMLSILIGAITIGLIAGMPFSQIVTAVNDGIGNTLKGIALLVGLGSMFGAILETSGGAQTLAVTMVNRFGDKKAAWALGITGLVIAMPVFFDAGLIILIPLAFSLAKRTKRSTLYYVIPLLAGLAVGHAFIPPTPGPVLVATMLGVDLGWVILIGIACGMVAMIVAGPVWGSICGKKYMVEVPEHIQQQEDIDESKLPSFGLVVTIILIPLVLIILDSLAGVVGFLTPVAGILGFLGEPFVALLIATLVAMYFLGTRHGYTLAELEKILTKSLEPTGLILLVTACGGCIKIYASVFRTGRCYRKCRFISRTSVSCGSIYCCRTRKNLRRFFYRSYDYGSRHYCCNAGNCDTFTALSCLHYRSSSRWRNGLLPL